MNNRQFQNMLRRRGAKQQQQRQAQQPAPVERVFRAPTAEELLQLEQLEDRARDARMLTRRIEAAMQRMTDLQAWHLLWRADRIMAAQKKKGYHHNAPRDKNGTPIPIRRQLGLPSDPKRAVLDTKVGVVPRHVKSLPNKGNIPIYKLVDFREVDHSPAMYMHSRLYADVQPLDLLKWLEKVLAVVESGKLPEQIAVLERQYGRPRQIVMPTMPKARDQRLQSRGTHRVAMHVRPRGARVASADLATRLRSRTNRQRFLEAKGSFRSIINRAFKYDIHRED